MDSTVVVEPIDRSEVRSESLGEKRPLENGVERDLSAKKARKSGEDVKLASNVKKVAEIVLVLATMGKMRGGRKPTPVEVEMMVEAREKLADICKEFAPKDIFPRDAFGTVIEDLGLNRLREQKLGIRPPKLSIAEKLQATKQKMEKSEVFPLHSNMYTPPRLQPNLSGPTENRGASNPVRIFPSDKANQAPVSSGSFQNPSNVVHASATNSRTLPYQLPTSEVRPMGSNMLHLGRDSSSLPVNRSERPHFRIDGGANGTPYTSQDHVAGKTPTWSMQSQSTSFTKVGSDKVPAQNSVKTEGPQGITSKPFITQTPPNPTNTNQNRMNFIQQPSAADTHNEVSRIVQKLLHPHVLDHPTWTPPSRDYMNKALTCQMCKITINEVDNTLVCDACERGYHLKCLQCNPKAIPRGEWQEWHCAKCLTISNGKPLPPKYGRVMRNISTPKLSSNIVGDQPSLDKNMQSSDNVNQQMVTENDGKLTKMEVNKVQETCVSNLVETSNEEKFTIVSKSQPSQVPTTLEAVTVTVNNHDDNKTDVPEITANGAIIKDESVKTSENCSVGPTSSSMHEVEWVGDSVKKVDGKRYYESCCIDGITYKVKDYALFLSSSNKFMPNKLQAMWEDENTKNKWVTVTRCFFPDDLPEGVGRPCAPESIEVYESNHETTLAAGLIHGPCAVLPPTKFSEESHLRATATDQQNTLFLCKWFYDETKRLFRDVTC